uniref:Fasciclin-1 n=1 Tax=Parascaris equorum TaxID=6256 RepID=A0A914RK90_PAREQ
MQFITVTALITLRLCVSADLWVESERISDLQQWRALCGRYTVAQAYMEDSNARITVFAPVDDVFTYNPNLRAIDQKETLSHIVYEIGEGKKWEKQTLIRSTINSGYIYITQFENNPGNFSYFANNGMLCNHASNQWGMISGEQYLYKICTPIGHRPYPGTAIIFKSKELSTVMDRNRIDRENRVLFTYPWLYDGGIHFYPSVRFSANIIEDNYKLRLTMRNITDRRTGRWDVYVVSEVYERYSQFRRGAVWAKIVVPNIPVQNGVVHIVDNFVDLLLLMDNHQCTTLMRYMNTIGQI